MRARVVLLPVVAVASLAVMSPAPSVAQTTRQLMAPHYAPDHPVPGQRLNKHDRQFIAAAAIDGWFELQMGNIAQNNARDPEVKRYGAWMARDYNGIDAKLAEIATAEGIAVPHSLNSWYAEQRAQLASLHGNAFDRAYMMAMVKDHDSDVRAFQAEVREGSDPKIKEFAANTLAALARYDQLAHQIDRSLTADRRDRLVKSAALIPGGFNADLCA